MVNNFGALIENLCVWPMYSKDERLIASILMGGEYCSWKQQSIMLTQLCTDNHQFTCEVAVLKGDVLELETLRKQKWHEFTRYTFMDTVQHNCCHIFHSRKPHTFVNFVAGTSTRTRTFNGWEIWCNDIDTPPLLVFNPTIINVQI